METKHGLVYDPSRGVVVGLVQGPIKEEEVLGKVWKEAKVKGNLATKVLMFFFVSSGGEAATPLGFAPTDTVSGKEAVKLVGNIITTLRKEEITVLWGSSDGFNSNISFVKEMATFHPSYQHIFDPSHILKNLRNLLEGFVVKSTLCPGGFSLKTLDQLRFGPRSHLYRRYFPETVFPKDKMDVGQFKNLINPGLLLLLKGEDDLEVQGLYEYLVHCQNLYDSFMDLSLSSQQRIDKAKASCEYFVSLRRFLRKKASISSNLIFQIMTSTKSLEALLLRNPMIKTYVLATLINENFFSLVRSKVLFPSFYEFCIYFSWAFQELVKRFSEGFLVNYRERKVGKRYPGFEGISFPHDCLNFEGKLVREKENLPSK